MLSAVTLDKGPRVFTYLVRGPTTAHELRASSHPIHHHVGRGGRPRARQGGRESVRRPAGARAWRELGRTRPRGRRLRVPQRRCAGERAVRVCCGEGAQTRRARAGAAGASRPRDPRRATARRALIMPAVPPDAASCSPLLRAAPQRAACATRGLGLLPRRENKKNMFFQKKPDWDKAADCYQKAAQIYRSSSVRRMRARARAHFQRCLRGDALLPRTHVRA